MEGCGCQQADLIWWYLLHFVAVWSVYTVRHTVKSSPYWLTGTTTKTAFELTNCSSCPALRSTAAERQGQLLEKVIESVVRQDCCSGWHLSHLVTDLGFISTSSFSRSGIVCVWVIPITGGDLLVSIIGMWYMWCLSHLSWGCRLLD